MPTEAASIAARTLYVQLCLNALSLHDPSEAMLAVQDEERGKDMLESFESRTSQRFGLEGSALEAPHIHFAESLLDSDEVFELRKHMAQRLKPQAARLMTRAIPRRREKSGAHANPLPAADWVAHNIAARSLHAKIERRLTALCEQIVKDRGKAGSHVGFAIACRHGSSTADELRSARGDPNRWPSLTRLRVEFFPLKDRGNKPVPRK
ncbi:MAG: hypothetical protein AABW54_04010 [Candidatus Micrarchaeota archaeon]